MTDRYHFRPAERHLSGALLRPVQDTLAHHRPCYIWQAERFDLVVGVIAWQRESGSQSIATLAINVDPTCRGQGVGSFGPAQRRSRGLHFIPEERLGRGAVPSMSLARNVLLTRHEAVGRYGFLGLGTMHQQAQALIHKYKVKASGPNASAKSLSGGNLQKFLVGREIDAAPKVLIVAQPTWGVDVGASAQIRAALLDLRNRGTAILLVSEELEELFEVSDRLMVIAQGRVSSGIPVEQASVEKVGAWMSGLFE